MNIEDTDWAKSFKKQCPRDYDEALSYAKQGRDLLVTIEKTDEVCVETWSYAVIVEGTDFWMDCLNTPEEAVALCKQMGWDYVLRR